MIPLFDGIAKEMRQAGLNVQKVPGWKTRGRDGTYAPRAVFEHHTASNRLSGNLPSVPIVTHGRPDLEGPLAQIVIGRDGTVVLIAAGRCNHAGYGGPLKGIPQDSGNAYAVALEIENDGLGEAYPPRQMRSVQIVTAIFLRRMKRGAYFAIGHKEWTPRKIDPSFAMDLLRAAVRHLLKSRLKRKPR